MKRIAIFGWGIVAPKSPNIETFEKNLDRATNWLEPFNGFGPSNFLVGEPDFDFSDYREWIEERFQPRKYSQLNDKMGNIVKYAVGAFIQSLNQNPGIGELLENLGTQTHIYVGTGLGDFPLHYEKALLYHKAQDRWNRFWCQKDRHGELATFNAAPQQEKQVFSKRLSLVMCCLTSASVSPKPCGYCSVRMTGMFNKFAACNNQPVCLTTACRGLSGMAPASRCWISITSRTLCSAWHKTG